MRTIALFFLVLGAAPIAAAPPCVISKGGLYKGLICTSTDPAEPAIAVYTAERVIIQRATVNHAGNGVEAVDVDGYQIAITNSKFTALDPGTPIRQRAIFIQRPTSVIIEHNFFDKGHGILIEGDPNLGNRQTQSVKVRLNDAVNIGYHGRPYPGTPDEEWVQFFQAVGGVYANLEIAWNRVTNFYSQSDVEDNINFYKASGTRQQPLDIHHNLIDGAWPTLSDNALEYSGGGIVVGDGDESKAGSFASVHDNRVINTANYGVAIAGGTDNKIFGNRVVSDARTHEGQIVSRADPGGIPVQNVYGGTMNNNSATDNAVALISGKGERIDFWLPACDPADSCVRNVSLPTPTTAFEKAERAAWEAERAVNKLTVGPDW